MKPETLVISKKEKLREDFSKLKVLLAHQLKEKYPREFVDKVFKKAKTEFEKMIPELPYLNLEERDQNPYLRLMIFSSMTMAIYLALRSILKSKRLARAITFVFFQKNLPGKYSTPIETLTQWMFSRFDRRRIKKELKAKMN